MAEENNSQSIEEILNNISAAIRNKTNDVQKSRSNYDLLELTKMVNSDGSIINLKKTTKNIATNENQLSSTLISDKLESESFLANKAAGGCAEIGSKQTDTKGLVEIRDTSKVKLGLQGVEFTDVESLLQDWINKNMPLLAREILEKEIKGLIDKIKSN